MLDRLDAGRLLSVSAAAFACGLSAAAIANRPIPGASIPLSAGVSLLVCGAGVLVRRGAPLASGAAALLAAVVLALTAAVLLDTIGALGMKPLAAVPWGRMPPDAAIGIGLAAGAVLMARRAPAIASLLGGLAGAIGASALVGHVASVETAYRWAHSRSMEPGAAVCLLLLGVAWWPIPNETPSERGVRAWRGALVGGVAAASLTLLFWQALEAHDETQLRRILEVGGERAEVSIRSGLRYRALGLTMLSREWTDRWLPSRRGWESDSRLTLAQSRGLLATEWIDRDGRVRWTYPEDVALPPPETLHLPRRSSRVLLTAPFEVRAIGLTIRALAPLRAPNAREDPEGWVSGAFFAPELFADLLSSISPSYVIEVSAEGRSLYRSGPESSPEQRRFAEMRTVKLPGGLALDVRVEPSSALIASARSRLPPALLVGGLAVSLLLALALGLGRVAAEQASAHARAAREVLRLNAVLERSVDARTAELARSNERLRQFVSFLSHELRQPLGTQVVWADLLETKHGDKLDDEGRSWLVRLRSGAVRMGELLEAQLALSAGRGTGSQRERVDLSSVVERVCDALDGQLASAGGEVEASRLPTVWGDRGQLEQLLRNLIENAVKYRHPVQPLRIRLSGEVRRGSALVRIEDNGRGFPLSEAARIFEVSVRLDPAAAPGAGVGLALCKQIALDHGGRIWASAAPSGGAVFTVQLPCADSSESPGS